MLATKLYNPVIALKLCRQRFQFRTWAMGWKECTWTSN